MQPLIDADVLRYECGYSAEAGWQQDGVPPFDYAAELLDMRIQNICGVVGATAPPILYLTGKHNFRTQIATRQPYKDRPSAKPWHFYNLTAYMKGNYDVRLTEGLEADDLMAIEQCKHRGNPLYRGVETIICTRDKDLFTFPGWKYSWELGNQPQRGPELISEVGYIRLSNDRKKIIGGGAQFFYSQCLTGDRTDSILGLPGCGPVKAYEALFEIKCPICLYSKVLSMYEESFGEQAEHLLTETARLLHMIDTMDGSKIKMWTPPDKDYEEWYDFKTGTLERKAGLQHEHRCVHMEEDT